MQFNFEAFAEDKPGALWKNRFAVHWPNYKLWYLQNGIVERASLLQCKRNLNNYMPEMVPVYEQLCALSGNGDLSSRFLSLYRPPAYIAGCSQLACNNEFPYLVRNYDYAPLLFDGFILKSRWLDKQVLGMADCLIGMLDGINENGLCASLAFGGSSDVGRGFGIPIIVRYVLETCDDVSQAKLALKRLPSHMAYNVTVLDKSGAFFTAQMRPSGDNVILDNVGIATNHQSPEPVWKSYADATYTYQRESRLQGLSINMNLNYKNMLSAFLESPLYANQYRKGHGTLYTSIYWPNSNSMGLYWPGQSPMHLGFSHFEPQHRVASYVNSTVFKQP